MLKKCKWWQKIVDEYSHEHDNSEMAKEQMVRMRQVIGFLGILLPWIVVLISMKYGGLGHWPHSISETWHTSACTPFMIILGSAAFVLICYKGYGSIDDYTLSFAGVMALGICLFPCKDGSDSQKIGTFMLDRDLSNTLHLVSAVLFFLLLAFTSLCLFTLGKEEKTEKKEKRNKIYRFCGWGMVAAMAAMLLGTYLAAHYKKYFEKVFECICGNRFCCLEFLMTSHVWLLEMIALTFFGVSFLTKANSFVVLHCDECERKRKPSLWLNKIKQALRKVF